MPRPFSSAVFPPVPSAALDGEALAEVVRWSRARADAWPLPERLSERPPLLSAPEEEDFDTPSWKRGPRPSPSAEAQRMLAMKKPGRFRPLGVERVASWNPVR